MCNIEYRLITTNDIPLMTDLLLERQKFECEVFSFLNNSCLNKEYIAKRLEDLFVKSKAIGVGAYINDEMVGYILSEMKVDTRKGRYAIIPYEGIAIKFDQPSELIRNLYAKIAVLWLEKGCFIHFAYIPLANKTYYDAFLRLSFAIEQVHAVLKIDDYVPFNQKTEMKVRLANKEDGELMGRMSSIISRFQNSTPVFSPAFPEVIAKIKENFIKLVQDESEVVFIA